ncbi:ubiquinone anaerobic biosynthesis protein UbiU [Gynuella sp.]|uniref:ubiquinone anaerobic biosynthesis protein UbiU n=1 Tax=Gynuella sp. TaxID=2969146 RepID=UPI003D0A66DC
MELVCPAGNLPSLKAAIQQGADAVYIGFKNQTNARHFAGLNFNDRKARNAIAEVRNRGKKLFVAINTYANNDSLADWHKAVDEAHAIGANAVILADIGLMEYCARKYPDLAIHLSVQGSATSLPALQFYQSHFNVKRAVLPRVLSIKQVRYLAEQSTIDLEVFGFGSLCIMAEGRCHLSSYLCGESPNKNGACSPARFVEWREHPAYLETRLNDVVIDRFKADEKTGYPTLCKGRFQVEDQLYHTLEWPTSLNTLAILPELQQAGVKAIKIEGRQRSPAYIENVARIWRAALDQLTKDQPYQVKDEWMSTLATYAEGEQTTLGAYDRPWQ